MLQREKRMCVTNREALSRPTLNAAHGLKHISYGRPQPAKVDHCRPEHPQRCMVPWDIRPRRQRLPTITCRWPPLHQLSMSFVDELLADTDHSVNFHRAGSRCDCVSCRPGALMPIKLLRQHSPSCVCFPADRYEGSGHLPKAGGGLLPGALSIQSTWFVGISSIISGGFRRSHGLVKSKRRAML